MSAADKEHLNRLVDEVLGRLLEDEGFDLEGFLREHPGSAAECPGQISQNKQPGNDDVV